MTTIQHGAEHEFIDRRAGSLLKSETAQQALHADFLPQIHKQIIDQAAAAAKKIRRQDWQCCLLRIMIHRGSFLGVLEVYKATNIIPKLE